MFVCVHSTRLGPACGGTRMKPYAEPGDALHDGLRLSGAMTAKNAVAGLPLGGGKAVLAVPEVPEDDRRRELFLRYGDLVRSLGGTYVTACDMNTSERDMDVVGERCPYVFGRSVACGGSGSSAPATATGVFHGIRASVAHAFGSSDLEGRTVLVQGIGSVGRTLARLLAQAGARLLVTDVYRARADEAAEALGPKSWPPMTQFGRSATCSRPTPPGRSFPRRRSPSFGAASWPGRPTTSWPVRRMRSCSGRSVSCTRRTTWSAPAASSIWPRSSCSGRTRSSATSDCSASAIP